MSVSVRSLPACVDPVAQPGRLVDARAGSGVVFAHAESPFPDDLPDDWDGDTFRGVFGGGVVAADLDRDGHIDLFFANGGGANGLFWGRGDGTFDDANAFAAGVSFSDEDTAFVSAADMDGDGDLDLLLTGWKTRRLLENLGSRFFEDVTAGSGIEAPPGYPGASAWADFDRDGDLDVFAGNYGLPNTGRRGAEAVPSSLYVQEDGVFVDRAGTLLPTEAGEEGIVLHAQWQDLDGDGAVDLVQVNDFGASQGNTMLWQGDGAGGAFVDRMPESGMGTLPFPMGTEFVDLDGDGQQDVFFSDLGMSHLYKRTDTWTWVDVRDTWASTVPDRDSDVSWSVVPLDLGGSGRPGLYVAHGPLESTGGTEEDPIPFEAEQPDRYLVPQGRGAQVVVAQVDVVEPPQIGRARGVAVADLNEDGVPDVVVNNLGGQPSLFLGQCTPANRLWVRLSDPTTPENQHAIGAQVEVEVDGVVQRQTLHAGGPGSGCAQEPVVHFGLAGATAVDRLTVRWPDGRETELGSVCAHCVLTLTARE